MVQGLNQAMAGLRSLVKGINEQSEALYIASRDLKSASLETGKSATLVAGTMEELARGYAEQANHTSQTVKVVEHLSELVSQMQRRTQSTVTAMGQEQVKVKTGHNLTTETIGTFNEIFRALMANLTQIESVAKSARQMAESNENVISAIHNIAAVTEESMASTEEVSATSEEQSASVEEVTALAENLSQIADNLKRSVAAFEI